MNTEDVGEGLERRAEGRERGRPKERGRGLGGLEVQGIIPTVVGSLRR